MTSVNAPSKNILQTTKRVELRFNEVDSMGLVWHGHYAKFFEDAREEFGKKFGLGYLDIYDSGFYAPLVDLQFKYKKPLTYRNRFIDVFAGLITIAILGFTLYRTILFTYDSYEMQMVSESVSATPLYLTQLVMPLGITIFALSVLVFVLKGLKNDI